MSSDVRNEDDPYVFQNIDSGNSPSRFDPQSIFSFRLIFHSRVVISGMAVLRTKP